MLITLSQPKETCDQHWTRNQCGTTWRKSRIVELPQGLQLSLQINKFVIPKSSQPSKWRLILGLSSPIGYNVNDGISRDLCSMRYATVDQAIGTIFAQGPGCLMAKIDMESAYHNIPVHADNRHLLAMSWNGRVFVDTQLSFP